MQKITKKKFHHVALLMGGLSAEREVSLTSGKEIAKALINLGYQVTQIDMERNIASVLEQLKPEVVFNALHGTYGEDGAIQGVLEILQIPYTHSGIQASSIAMDKDKSIKFFKENGLNCPNGETLSREELIKKLPSFKPPYVIKPVSEGSSVGVHIVLNESQIPKPEDIYHTKNFLIEEYIKGIELSVAVIDEKPLGVIELEPISDFYSYENKYTTGKTNHYMPARIAKEYYTQAMDIAYKAHNILGCKNLSRSDLRFDPETGKLYLLELNTHPGMTPLSLVPEIAKYSGISFEQLVQYLLENAQCGK